jgi:ribonuclease HI
MTDTTNTTAHTDTVEAAPSVPDLPRVAIWTDGGCRPNPGIGGWAVLMQAANGNEKTLSGGAARTTNNKMEMTAAIEALETLSRPFAVTLYTDSEYLFLTMKDRLARWRRNGWRTAKGRPVENVDLWQRLATAAERHQVEWVWMRGHAGDPMNERVDRLATEARDKAARFHV